MRKCQCKGLAHSSACRLRDKRLPTHEDVQHRAAYGRADADIAPTRERYYPLDRPLPDALEGPTVDELMAGPVASYAGAPTSFDLSAGAMNGYCGKHDLFYPWGDPCPKCWAAPPPDRITREEIAWSTAQQEQELQDKTLFGRSPALVSEPKQRQQPLDHFQDRCPICSEFLCAHPRAPATALPTSALARKMLPMATGLLDYFPAALVAVAGLSKVGNEQHNPGQPLHWARGKSGDEGDALVRHFIERGTYDTDGIRHSTKVAWRALALLQKELEEAGLAPLSRGSR